MNSFKTGKGTELPLLNLKGKDYLQVAYRLVWFREECPEWSIETRIVTHDDQHTVFEATVRNKEGRIMATGHQREDAQDFRDHLAKAETAAIGRALALIGFGTQFADLDEGDRIVDSPVERLAGKQVGRPQAQAPTQTQARPAAKAAPAKRPVPGAWNPNSQRATVQTEPPEWATRREPGEDG